MTNEKVLCLRTCASDMTSYGGFKWPKKGTVEAPDWKPTVECGNGLHGLLWGEGDGSLLSFAEDAVWLVFEADAASVVDLGGKVKVPSAKVVKTGSRDAVTSWLAERAPGRSIVGVTATAGNQGTATAGNQGTATAGDRGTATAGYRGTATAGDRGTATAGDQGTATAGDRGTATAGHRGTATAGDRGTATAGYRGTATAGYGGTATAGDGGTATAGDRGTATAGYRGTATAGYRGTATAGDRGTATAGYRGTATAGNQGTATAGNQGTATAGNQGTATAGDQGTATAGDAGLLIIKRWNGKRYRWTTGEIGEDKDAYGNVLEPNVAYQLNDDGQFVRKSA